MPCRLGFKKSIREIRNQHSDMNPIRSTLFAVALTALVGCSPLQNRTDQVQSDQDGGWIMRLVPNQDGVQAIAGIRVQNYVAVTLKRLPEASGRGAEFYSFAPTGMATKGSMVFGGALPAGVYAIDNFDSSGSKLELKKESEHFEVRSHQLTDIGVFIEEDATAHKAYLIREPEADGPATDEMVRETLPLLRNMLSNPINKLPIQAVNGSLPTDSAALEAVSRGLINPVQLRNGAFMYGTWNGVVMVWTPGGETQAFDTGARMRILNVLERKNDGGWVAAGELGVIKESNDKGASWHSIRRNLPFGKFVSLNQSDEGRLYATIQFGEQVFLYSSDSPSQDWKLIGRYHVAVDIMEMRRLYPTVTVLNGHVLVTNLGEKLVTVDTDKGTVETFSPPGNVLSLALAKEGEIWAKVLDGGIRDAPYASRDSGATWTQRDLPHGQTIPIFQDPQHGVAWRPHFLAEGARIVYTENGGTTWVGSDFSEDIVQFVNARDGKAIYGFTVYGKVLVSRDGGRSWSPGR